MRLQTLHLYSAVNAPTLSHATTHGLFWKGKRAAHCQTQPQTRAPLHTKTTHRHKKSVPQKAVASYAFSIFSPTFSKQSMKKAGKIDKIALKNA